MKTLNYASPRFNKQLLDFMDVRNEDPQVIDAVAGIIREVRSRGDEAVIELTEKFDGFRSSPKDLRVPAEALKAGVRSLSKADKASIREAADSVRSFHKEGLPRNWTGRNPHGATVGERWYPIQRVGIYIPAGNVPLVSTVVMTVTLAKLAGVPEIAVFTPAKRDGNLSPQMLGGLKLCGVSEVYRIGGAQAIACMAYGTQTIRPVCKVMGPGNAYVVEAQRQVFGTVGIDLIPGPSEAMAIADASAHPEWLAADLLAQAEHGSGREKIFLVSQNSAQIAAVKDAVKQQLGQLKHADAIRRVLNEGTALIEVPDLAAAVEVANTVAPEHLELHVERSEQNRLIKEIHTAGAILCGNETPTVLGDFTAGPSHTLPTGRTGRFFSGLKITDFMRRSSIVRYNRRALTKARSVVETFSRLEDLDAHGQSLEIRFQTKTKQ